MTKRRNNSKLIADPTQQQATAADPSLPTLNALGPPEINNDDHLKAYYELFGQQGAGWYLEGKSLVDCFKSQIGLMNDQVETLEGKLFDLEANNKALRESEGGRMGLSQGNDGSIPDGGFKSRLRLSDRNNGK